MTETNKSKSPTVKQVSAGGIVYRELGGKLEIVIVAVNPSLRWQLPKGIVDDGETLEAAALREVLEETGITAELIMPVDVIEYWYAGTIDGERVRFHKFVHFYLMKHCGGSVENHDHEIAEARWVEAGKSLQKLAFSSERETVQKAFKLIS